jgi:seryl-tRNA synthetase
MSLEQIAAFQTAIVALEAAKAKAARLRKEVGYAENRAKRAETDAEKLAAEVEKLKAEAAKAAGKNEIKKVG